MRMKRLFAGLAAAATLLGGMALGTATANAADVSFEKTITVTASDAQQFYTNRVDTTNEQTLQENLRTFKYVKLAGYQQVTGSNAVQLTDGLTGDAANKAFQAAGYDQTKDGNDPWQWLGTTSANWQSGQLTGFVDALKDSATTAVVPIASNDGKTLTFTFDTPGLYLIVDQSGDVTVTDTTTEKLVWRQNSPFLAGTKIDNAYPSSLQNVTGSIGEDTINAKSRSEVAHKGGFTFHKTDAANAPVGGAVFAVKNSDNKYGLFDGTNWTWTDAKPDVTKLPTEDADRKAAGFFVSGNYGSVVVEGLTEGTYTVEEIKAADGFLQTALPSFTVTIDDKDGKGQVTAYDVNSNDAWNLVDGDVQSGVTVKNVRNITQLPLTGAAGTILFSVVALLLAGAGVTVFVRSRRMSKQLA